MSLNKSDQDFFNLLFFHCTVYLNIYLYSVTRQTVFLVYETNHFLHLLLSSFSSSSLFLFLFPKYAYFFYPWASIGVTI